MNTKFDYLFGFVNGFYRDSTHYESFTFHVVKLFFYSFFQWYEFFIRERFTASFTTIVRFRKSKEKYPERRKFSQNNRNSQKVILIWINIFYLNYNENSVILCYDVGFVTCLTPSCIFI